VSENKGRRVVVKVGTRLLTDATGNLKLEYIEKLVHELAQLKNEGHELILVSSGAIGAGVGKLGMTRRPTAIPEKQAAAAVGQGLLIQIYEKYFADYGLVVAQILLTRSDLISRRRCINASNTVLTLLRWGVIPIINENDTVSVEEIKFGDNDRLSALVAALIDANLLIILTTVDGLYDGNPQQEGARLIPVVKKITRDIKAIAGPSGDDLATGGMITKLKAAEIVTKSGIGMYIANGTDPTILGRILKGEQLGTYFQPEKNVLNRRKRWIAYGRVVRGSIVIDDGAKIALCQGGKSLLPVGVIQVKGEFKRGDLISVYDRSDNEVGRGLSNFSSEELLLIMRHSSSQIPALLGRPAEEEVIHRDNLVVY
jgi:glutamate 5-kinase